MFNKFSKMVLFMRYVWKNPVELDRPQTTMWNLHIACWVTKATNTQDICYCFSAATMVA